MITQRTLARDEIPLIWGIDRSELTTAIYRIRDGGLVREQVHFDQRGWPPGEAALYTPILEECYDHGGWFCGLFDDGKLIGIGVLGNCMIGSARDQLQLAFLHVGNGYRGRGLGRQLFLMAAEAARGRGASALYISATPSEQTVRFYTGLGCALAAETDPELFAREPEDIHLIYPLGA